MASGLQDQRGGYRMAEEKPVKAWRRILRAWLVGGSFSAIAGFVPAVAQAKIYYHHGAHTHRLAGHAHQSVRHFTHKRDAHVVHADYRPDHHQDLYGHGRSAKLIHADYRPDNRRDLHHRDRDARLVHIDYRTDHRRDSYRHDRDVQLIRVDDHIYREDGRARAGRVLPRFSCSHLQCVPYAREVSHIELSGDAFLWWAQAAGRYGRGHLPAIGAVLNFRATGRMPLGHVAVVTAVLNPRTILVTQANWVPGTITNDVTVDDVSPDNNWSEVRVEYGDGSQMGSVYPTYGFIYNRPASAPTIYAANEGGRNEVAEAPVANAISTQAPNRSLR